MADFLAQSGTTSLILGWSLLLSVLLVVGLYETKGRHLILAAALSPEEPGVRFHQSWIHGMKLVPAVMLVPLLIWFFYWAFGLVLIFPPSLTASTMSLAMHAFLPAVTLLIASGFVGAASNTLESEIRFWASKPFLRLSLALGKNPHTDMRRLIIARNITGLWSKTLPWFFGELVVVEALFNAPGLGTSLWEAARRFDQKTAATGLLLILVVFIVFSEANRALSRWVGKRLESYG